jgi:hypothetical protein
MMIDEVNASKKAYIRDTPQYVQWGFLGQQDKRFMNRKSDGGHPFSQQPSQTYYEDPLIVGSTEHHKGSFLQYNNRAIESSTKHLNGGAMMYQQPQDSDSDSDYSSSSDEEEGGALMYQQPKADKYKGGDLSQMTKEELMEMIQGGGVYEDYIKPAGKFLGHVGKEIVNEVIVPVGKELVKDAVRGAVRGGGKRGRPKGSKNKNSNKFEEIVFQPPPSESDPAYARQIDIAHRGQIAHLKDEIAKLGPTKKTKAKMAVEKLLSHVEPITQRERQPRTKYEEVVFGEPSESEYLKQMDKAHRGEMAHLKDEIAKLVSEKGRVEGEKKFEEGMIKEAPKKARKPRKKVERNIEDELKRVEGEIAVEKARKRRLKIVPDTKKEGATLAVQNLLSNVEPIKDTPHGSKVVKAKRGMTDKAKERAEIVKQVMKDRNLKLGAASKYVKEHGLWKPATGEWF